MLKTINTPEFKLYCGYAMSSWGDRLWEFGLGLILVNIGSDLRLVAISGMINSLAVFIFASVVGAWIDKTRRLVAAQTILLANNVTVALSAASLASILYWKSEIADIWGGYLRLLLIAISIGFCALGLLAGTGANIVMTRDWVVVMCNGDRDRLAETNAWLLRISLAAMILSPLIAGQLMTSFGTLIGTIVVIGWNIGSYPVQYFLLNSIYRSIPKLAEKQIDQNTTEPTSADLVNTNENDTKVAHRKSMNICLKIGTNLRNYLIGWKSYYRHAVFPAALSMAFLYLTVLGFDNITTGYIYSQGIAENILALARGTGALFGIAGSLIYPRVRARVGLQRCGLLSYVVDLSCLSLALVSIWLPGSPFDLSTFTNHNSKKSLVSIIVFLVGIVLARCGLWMVDLTVTQIMQESIDEHERGALNGVQSSLNQLMSLIKDVLVIVLPNIRTFGLLIIISYASIVTAFMLFCIYSRRIRGHILPLHNLRAVRAFEKYIFQRKVIETNEMTRM